MILDNFLFVQSGEPMVLDKLVVKQGFLRREKQEVWEYYMFQLENSTHLKYYSDLKKVRISLLVGYRLYQQLELTHYNFIASEAFRTNRTAECGTCY